MMKKVSFLLFHGVAMVTLLNFTLVLEISFPTVTSN